MKKKKLVIGLFILFICLLSLTIYTSFSSNIDEQEIVIKSMVPVYDETSTIEVDNNNVVFNDKNQVVKYNVVLENTQNYDVKISDIKLSTPTEEFLDYKVEGIEKNEVLSANSTKELTVSFETMRIDGWGRNFADELIANINFEKKAKQEEVVPPVEETPKEEEKQPEAPATNIEEIVKESEKLEVESITNNTIEFKDGFKVEDASKVETWIYPESEFYGYKEVDESKIIKEIVLEKERLDELEITPGEHKIVISTEEEILGYIDIYINEDKEISKEKPQDTTDKEDLPVTKPSTDNKDDEKVENPYTSNNGLVVVFGVATFITGIAIIFLCNKKVAKYTVFIFVLSPALTITNADEVIEVAIKNNVSFESQNVMTKAYGEMIIDGKDGPELVNEGLYYWGLEYRHQIKNIYIENDITEITDYVFKFDVSEKQDGKVIAYLAKNIKDSDFYDLHLQADGIIYPNPNARMYFAMRNLDSIINLSGMDTSNVTSMGYMFYGTGHNSTEFTLDVSNFDTSQVTDMSYMFNGTGYNSTEFTLDVSNFDTSQVTDMSYMFNYTGYNGENFTLDLSNFDTSNVTDMNHMFWGTGGNSPNFALDVSNFDTSQVTDMSFMFDSVGRVSKIFTLDLSNFETSKVTDMRGMFANIGSYNPDFTLDLRSFDTSNVTDMAEMFASTGYDNPNFTLDLSHFDTSNVTYMEFMFSHAGYNSTKLNISITISNPNTKSYYNMFEGVATKNGAKITLNYTAETDTLVSKMISTKQEGSNVVKGNCIDCGEDYIPIGTEIDISGEKFNVISQTDDTVTMLAHYNIGTDYKQSTTANGMAFADTIGWEYTPGPKEIDIQNFDGNAKTYVNEYVTYLQGETGDTTLSGNLITLTELKGLGCTIKDDYSWTPGPTCANSSYKSWLVNGQDWWTRSATSTISYGVWDVRTDGRLSNHDYNIDRGVRPVITISKDTIKNLS